MTVLFSLPEDLGSGRKQASVRPFVVPQLLEKLNILVRYSELKSIGDIAAKFGVSEDAVRFWTKDTASQLAGTVPRKRRDGLISMYAKCLPDHSTEEILTLLQGPVPDLEDALRFGEFSALTDVIGSRVDATSATLIPVDVLGMGLVVSNRLSKSAHCKFPLKESFRLEFRTKHRGQYVLGLQHSPQAWGCTDVTWSRGETIIHMPGADEKGNLGSMDESSDVGISQFYAFQSRTPFPSIFAKALADRVPLARADISLLAQYLQSKPTEDLHIMRFDVEFIDKPKS